jgi:hypothetical protein
MLNVILQSVVLLSEIFLSIVILSVVMQCAVMLNVVLLRIYAECRSDGCQYANCHVTKWQHAGLTRFKNEFY